MLWYICSGKVKLPKNFESCTSKEDLWTKVRRGARPEYLPFFDPKMWTLMQNCWRGSPEERLKLGEVEDELKQVLKLEARKVRISLDSQQMPPPGVPLAPPLAAPGSRPITGRSSNRAQQG